MELKNEFQKFIVDRTTRYSVMAKSQEAVEQAATSGVIFGNLSPDFDQFSVSLETGTNPYKQECSHLKNSSLDYIKEYARSTGETQIRIAMDSGEYLTQDEWVKGDGAYSTDDVIGIAVITPLISFIVGPHEFVSRWSEDNEHCVTEAHTEAQALQVISGFEHTRQLVKAQENEGDTAAKLCWDYDRKGLQWYLPCLLELNAICANKEEINALLEFVDGDALSLDRWYWSSTECNANYSWYVYFGSGGSGNNGKYYTGVVRPAVAI